MAALSPSTPPAQIPPPAASAGALLLGPFDCLSDTSRDPVDVAKADQVNELVRLTAALRGQIGAKDKAGEPSAKFTAKLNIWLAILADIDAREAWDNSGVSEPLGAAWADKIRLLRGEIAKRRNAYPAMVAAGQLGDLSPDMLARRLEAVEVVHFRYWRLCLGIEANRHPATGAAMSAEGFRAVVLAHLRCFAGCRNGQDRGALL